MSKQKKHRQKKRSAQSTEFRVIRPSVAGLDVGSCEHWVCGPQHGDVEQNVQTFGTTTPELEKLAAWLQEQGVESVAMESTHVYWIPVYELLESRGIECVLVNARTLHNVPGRKTDMKDCQWLQMLHSYGLLRASFRPKDAICRLRGFRRQLANLVEQKGTTVQWMQKCLDQMNVQVHRAVTDITGKTGMAIIRAIVNGERDPRNLAAFRDRRCRKTEQEIAEHLKGNWREEHLFNLNMGLRQFDFLAEQIAAYEAEMLVQLEKLQPEERKGQEIPPHPNKKKEQKMKDSGQQDLRTALWRFSGVDLTRIDGIGPGAAQTVLTEVGPDISAFPTEGHFAGWVRLTPRNPISGGKPTRKRGTRTGAVRIANVLRMAAVAVGKTQTAIGAYFRRIARRKGADVAVFATARKLAQYIYRMLRYGQDYVDIGAEAYNEQFTERRIASMKKAANSLGYQLVQIEAGA